MSVSGLREDLDHASFITAGSTFAAYALLLIGMTVVLFGIPYLLFVLL